MQWPWQRATSKDAETETASAGPAGASGQAARVPPAGWAFLPAMQRVTSDMPVVSRPLTGRAQPAAWHNPSFVTVLTRVVDTSAPRGVIDGDGRGTGSPVAVDAGPELDLGPTPGRAGSWRNVQPSTPGRLSRVADTAEPPTLSRPAVAALADDTPSDDGLPSAAGPGPSVARARATETRPTADRTVEDVGADATDSARAATVARGAIDPSSGAMRPAAASVDPASVAPANRSLGPTTAGVPAPSMPLPTSPTTPVQSGAADPGTAAAGDTQSRSGPAHGGASGPPPPDGRSAAQPPTQAASAPTRAPAPPSRMATPLGSVPLQRAAESGPLPASAAPRAAVPGTGAEAPSTDRSTPTPAPPSEHLAPPSVLADPEAAPPASRIPDPASDWPAPRPPVAQRSPAPPTAPATGPSSRPNGTEPAAHRPPAPRVGLGAPLPGPSAQRVVAESGLEPTQPAEPVTRAGQQPAWRAITDQPGPLPRPPSAAPPPWSHPAATPKPTQPGDLTPPAALTAPAPADPPWHSVQRAEPARPAGIADSPVPGRPATPGSAAHSAERSAPATPAPARALGRGSAARFAVGSPIQRDASTPGTAAALPPPVPSSPGLSPELASWSPAALAVAQRLDESHAREAGPPEARQEPATTPPAPVAGAVGAEQIDELVHALTGPLLRRVKAELLLDRERRGLRTDAR